MAGVLAWLGPSQATPDTGSVPDDSVSRRDLVRAP